MKKLAFIIGIWFILSPLLAQESFRIEWEIEDNLTPLNAIVDSDGNTVVVGNIGKVNQNYDRDGFIFKMTPEGEYSYYRYPYLPDSSISFEAIIQISNGNYFVFGSYGPNDYYDPDEKTKVCIFNQSLDLIIEKNYNLNPLYEKISNQKLLLENDGDIICAATTKRKSTLATSEYDLVLFRFLQNGDTIETKYIHYQRNISVYDFDKIPNSDNYLILEFITQLYGDFECYILKQDLSADTINFHYSYDYSVYGNKTCDYWYPDKSFMMASDITLNSNPSDLGFGVLRCDTLANTSNYLFLNNIDIYDDNAHNQCMAFAGENSIFVAGYTADYWDCNNPDSIELYVVDTSLNQIAYKSLGGDISYDAWGVLRSHDNGAIIYCKAWYPDGENCHGNLVIYYVNRSDLGLPPVKVFDTPTQFQSSICYPNPANDFLRISINRNLLEHNSRIKIYNTSGRKVYDYKLPNIGNTLQLNIKNLEKGMYIYTVTGKNKITQKNKFIKN